MLVVIIDVYLVTNLVDYMDVNYEAELLILILTNQAVFVTLSVVKIPGAAIFILKLNHADVIGDQSDAVTQNAWLRCTLCAVISGEISILIQTGAESWGRFPVPKICRWEIY